MEQSKIITLGLMLAIIVIALFTSKFNSNKQYEIKKQIRLFPFWVKYLGMLITISSIVFYWCNLNLFDEQSTTDFFWPFGIAIGLLTISISKEKNEDEMTMSLRLNSVFFSFFVGIMSHLMFVLLELLAGGNIDHFNSLYATNFILFAYVIYFHWTKRRTHK